MTMLEGENVGLRPLKNGDDALFFKWRNELEKTWKALESGKLDWAALAMAIWPDRVRKKCAADKSLAITHGLEG